MTPGAFYRFRVRAKNIFGYGTVSSFVSVKAATVPETVPSVITSIDATTGGVTINWGAPYDNGDTITGYLVEIGVYGTPNFEPYSGCDGSQAAVMASRSCVIPMSALTSSPYFYIYDSTVLVRVIARNSFGDGTAGLNTGAAKIRSVPSAAPAITINSYTDFEITISWTSLSGNNAGNSIITAYDLYWNDGSGSATIEVIE